MRFTATLLLTFYLLLTTSSVAIASESALSASPAILEAVVKPGEPTTTTITIQNNTNFPLPVKGSASAFLANEDIPVEAKDTFNASRWFDLDPADFILQPKELKKIQVTINPPKDAEPGGHYATLYFRPLIPEDAVSGNTVSLARIGILAMMIVPGDIQESLTQSRLLAPGWLTNGPLTYMSNLTNGGSIHLLPKTTLTITNIWGEVVHEQVGNPSIVLPQTTKEQKITWDKRYGLGPYTATIMTYYGTDQKPLISNSVTTWFVPWHLVLTTLILLTFAYKIFIVNRRRLVLAYRVLRGTYEPSQTNQKNTRHNPRINARSNTSRNPTLNDRRSPRRNPNR